MDRGGDIAGAAKSHLLLMRTLCHGGHRSQSRLKRRMPEEKAAGRGAQAAGVISSGSISGGGAGWGRLTGRYRPWEMSEKTRLAVSSVRVESMCSARMDRITTVARRKRFSMMRSAEYTRSDRMLASFPGNGALATEAGLDARTQCGSACREAPNRQHRKSRSGERSRAGWEMQTRSAFGSGLL